MGYSRNLSALEPVRKYLNQMLKADGKISWTVRDAPTTAYLIRQGLYLTELHRLKEYKGLKSKFTIRVQGNKVTAEPRSYLDRDDALSEMVLHDITDTLEVIGAALKHGAEKFFFPDATAVDLHKLYDWTSKNGYHIIPSSEGLTLTKQAVGEIAWTPQT